MGGKHRPIETGELDLARHLLSDRLVIERQAGIQQRLGGSAIGEAGVEMMKAVFLGDPARERALAGCGRSVDGDGDHKFPAIDVVTGL
ncbi:hypothetical protein D9M70_567260 [compost metagenome]